MFIERMLVNRFRHLRDVELGPFRQPAEIGELIVLAGPNGSGKSSLLELLSLGIATRYNYQYYQARQISNHAFGIKIALAASELAELEAQAPDEAVLEYARRNRGYWVHVNLPSVFGPNEQGVNDRVHAAASHEFANFARRLGFFIRSDRSYGARSYRRDHLFNWKNREQPNHLGTISYSATNAQYEDMYNLPEARRRRRGSRKSLQNRAIQLSCLSARYGCNEVCRTISAGRLFDREPLAGDAGHYTHWRSQQRSARSAQGFTS